GTESARAVAQQDRQARQSSDRQVLLAVAVEITYGCVGQSRPDIEISRSTEPSGPYPKQDRQGAFVSVNNDEVLNIVGVEKTHGDRYWIGARAHGKVARGTQAALPIAQEDRDVACVLISRDEVWMSVVVEIAHCDRY